MELHERRLREKYGEQAVDEVRRLEPERSVYRLARSDALDPHFTKLWLDFAVTGLAGRSVLDARTRALVRVGQLTMARAPDALAEAVRSALATGVPAREVLEIILQCVVYGGQTTVAPALERFYEIAEALGLLEELRATALPLEGNDRNRSYDEERNRWHPEDLADPRCEPLMRRHGWLAVGRGLALRPRHHLNVLAWLDAMDSHFAGLWVKFVYQGMYARGVVDDKTRLLCMIGNCIAVGEQTQVRGHMRGALRNGASAREVLEVIFLSSALFGMPRMFQALQAFVELLAEDGRLAEIGNPPPRVDSFSR